MTRLRRGVFELIADRATRLGVRPPRMDWKAMPTWSMLTGDAKRLTNWQGARE